MKQQARPQERQLARRISLSRRLRPLLPEAISHSDLIDRRRGALIRRLLRVARDSRRAAAIAERRGITIWGDTAQRFDLLFIDRDSKGNTWLLDKSGHRVAWLGGGETIEVASFSLPVVFDPRVKANDDPAIARLRRRLREIATGAARGPKRTGRPRGSRDMRPRLIGDHDRATHEQLAGQLRHVRETLGWRSAAIFRKADSPAGHRFFNSKTLALLARISTHSTCVEMLRRLERQFRPAK